MEKWYLIYAYEHRYEGLFGINDWLILWTTPVAAQEEAEQLSRQIIKQDGVDVFFHDTKDCSWEEAVEKDIGYQVWELTEEIDEMRVFEMEDVTEIITQYGVRLVWVR